MGLFEQFPYTNYDRLNLDALVQAINSKLKEMDNFISYNSLKYADPIQWNITSQYGANTIVLTEAGNAYLSKKPVPAGIVIDNDEYWTAIGNFTGQVEELRTAIAAEAEERTAADAVLTADTVRLGERITLIEEQSAHNVKDFGAVGDGVTDDIGAFEQALEAAVQDNGAIVIPPGTYALSRTWHIGDGSALSHSTYNDVKIVGMGAGSHQAFQPGATNARTVLKRIGTSLTPVVQINGPILNVHIENLKIDCNTTANIGLLVIHTANSTFNHLTVVGHREIALKTTTVPGIPAIYGTGSNLFDMFTCDYGGTTTAIGVMLTGDLTADNAYKLDSCRNVFIRPDIYYPISGKGIVLEFADNNVFIEGMVYGASGSPEGSSVVLQTTTQYPAFPCENVFYNTAIIYGVSGSPTYDPATGNGANSFIPYPVRDGEPIPNMPGAHVILPNGRSFVSGMEISREVYHTYIPIPQITLSETWADAYTFPLNTFNDPASIGFTYSLKIIGNVQVRMLRDGSEIQDSFRVGDGTVGFSPLVNNFYVFTGSGYHTYSIQVAGTGTLLGGTLEIKAIL